MNICPCQIHPSLPNPNPLSYQDCCAPYHDAIDNRIDESNGIKADSAERLMRTRYSAFVKVLPDYIVKTTVPNQQHLLDVKAIEDWAKDTDWAGLEIINHSSKLGKRHAQVEFKAYFDTPDGIQAHHELSAFVKVVDKTQGARWYFLDPTVNMRITQKQPCICGSGEKFKRCCGRFL